MDSSDSAKIQHVNKKSSDELLRKFAEVGSASGEEAAAVRKALRVAKRRNKNRTVRESDQCESPSNGSNGNTNSTVEKRWLLPHTTRKSVFLRQLGIGRSRSRARDIRNKSILGAIEKTWRKTVEGASKVFVERHYNQHKLLMNDVV